MNKRAFNPLIFPAIWMVVANCGQIRAQTSPGFTAVLYDYFGCDPAVTTTAPAPCPPKGMQTKYVDPNIGTSMVMSTQTPTPTNTLVTKNDGTRVQAFHEINVYYSVKLNINPAASGQSGVNCMPAGTTLLGTETILGIETYKYQQGEVQPGNAASTGSDGTISWLAPGLNCFSLRTEFHFKGSPTTFQLASNVTLGTPPASAFDPPPGFVELSPMDATHKLTVLVMRRLNPAMTTDEAEAAWSKTSASNIGLQRMDAMWRKQHGITQ